ncbi:N-acetylmuramoyl-L-alanine amidase [Nocardia bovistercoris]|uniref:N-acetylmuramoyl-L-alanine amidase n=1 Tax=Nocardia bovistercoris TaxID=2785916 RepID=A0A931N7D1_9NOCA|nr:N-acetylmuramoyl-L-alanine amidase [Nocardia bovistercoris]MBH0781657.1 N-acetylmuramoyl-L-alanine amidase [Nocardia bovistercoris]
MKPTIIKTGLRAALAAAVVVSVSAVAPAAVFADPVPPDVANKLAGRTVFVDPGHQGTGHGENLSRQVDNGRGGAKDCQTTGMTSLNGIPEHTINWNVAQLVKTALESLGARVVLSRPDDTGWGGCVDDRARAANASGAAVAVSIHADGAPAGARGFHLIVPQLPIPDAVADRVQSTEGLAATKAVRDAYVQAGFQPANYAGVQDGLQTRADIAGPALTRVPGVFVEMGNGGDPQDAAVLESPDGQLKHAVAITTGLVGYLLSANPAGTTGSAPDRPATAPDPAAPKSPAPSTPSPEDGGDLVAMVTRLLSPLTRALGIDDTMLTTQLINMVYSLAGMLSRPTG